MIARVRRAVSSLRPALECVAQCLYPPRCKGCGIGLFGHAPALLCPGCFGQFNALCLKGREQTAHVPAKDRNAGDSNPEPQHPFTQVIAAARYGTPSRELVLDLKFGHNLRLSRALGDLMARRLEEELDILTVDALVPVPLHPKRLRQRGYNQSELLARAIGKALALPVRPAWLRRVRNTHAQSLLSREERLSNPVGAFLATPGLEGARVALVDDVLTTGATAAACAQALRQAGAARVYVVTFAR